MYNFEVFNSPKNTATPQAILVLHGWGGNLSSLHPLASELAKLQNLPIFNLELPGFGQTELIKSQMNVSDFADFVQNFVIEKKIENVVIIGHSFGGKIILDILTSQSRIKVAKAVFVCNSGIKPHNSIKKNVSKFLSRIVPSSFKSDNAAKKFFYTKILREHDYINAGKLKPTLSQVVEEHYDDKLSQVSIPTLIIWGENDGYVPLWMGRKMQSEITNSKLVVVPEASHSLPLKKPTLVAEIISEWIKSQ